MGRTRHILVGSGIVGALFLMGGTVSYFEETQPQTLNPLFARTMADRRTQELVFDRMFYRSAITNEIRSHVILDDGKMGTGVVPLGDGRSVKLVLRPKIKWHDGKPLEGEDICFTINALLNPKTPSPQGKDFRESIESCVATSKDSATVTFKKVYHNPRSRLDFSIMPAHKFESTAVSPDDEFSKTPVGTGPMSAVKGRRGTTLTGYENTHHKPGITDLKQSEAGDPLVAVKTIIGGGVQGLIAVAPPYRPEVAASTDLALKSYDLRSWWFIAVNTTDGPAALKDKRIRQALNLALDRNSLRELTIGVKPTDPNPPCEFVSGPFVGSSPYYNRSVKVIEKADPDMVKLLMSGAGAVNDKGRWLFQGAPINIRIGMNAPLDHEAPDLVNQIGNQLGALGFDRQVYKVADQDWGRQVITGGAGQEYDMVIGKWSFGLVEDVNSLFATRKGGQGALNIFNYSNPKVDEMLARYDKAHTDTEAKDSYHALHAYLAEDLPYLFLWKLDTKSAWRNEIKGNIIAPYYYFTEFDGWSTTM